MVKFVRKKKFSVNYQSSDNNLWLELASRGLDKHPLLQSAQQHLSLFGDDEICRNLILDAIHQYDVRELLITDPFERTNPTHADGISGEIRLGKVAHTGAEWGIQASALVQHMMICGITGGGKSRLIESILRQTHGVTLCIVERKPDFMKMVVGKGMPYFSVGDFVENILAPGDGVQPKSWYNLLAELFISSFGLRAAAQSELLHVLLELHDENNSLDKHPTLAELKARLNKRFFIKSGSSREITSRLYERISWLVTMLGDSVTSESCLDWQKLMKSGWAVSLAGIPSQIQSLWIAVYFAKVLTYRIANNLRSDKLEVLFVFDEASPIFPKSASKTTSILLDSVAQCRAFGIGVLFSSQSMSISDGIIANTALKVAVGGLGLGSDYESFGSSVGLTRAQRDYMRKIAKPGAAVVRDIRYPHPFTVQLDYTPEGAPLSPKEIKRISKESKRRFLIETPVTRHGQCSDAIESKQHSESDVKTCNNQAATLMRDKSGTESQIHHGAEFENALRIIRAQHNNEIQFLFRKEAARLAGIRGTATLLRAENVGLRAGIINRHVLPRGRVNISLWEITDKGYELIGCKRPQWKSKGDYLHKFCAHRICDSESKRGCNVTIEYCLVNGKLVDVRSVSSERDKYIEICASYPLEKELINLQKDFETEAIPDELIFAVTERQMKSPLAELFEQYANVIQVSCSVSVVLAGDLIDFLEVNP